MSNKPVQTLSFGDDNVSNVKKVRHDTLTKIPSQPPSQPTKRKEIDGGFNKFRSKYDPQNDPVDKRSDLQQLQDNNKRQKQLEQRREDNMIKESQHNRLEGGIQDKKLNHITNNKHRAHMKTNESLARDTALYNLHAERLLQPSTKGSLVVNDDNRGITTTRHVRQADLYNEASATVKAKAFTLQGLEYGAYHGEYTRNGAYLLLAGDQGHINVIDWRNGKPLVEQQLQEQIFDACFLQDHTLYAVAQKRYVCLYDATGTKVHHLKSEMTQFPRKLQFLPHHFLLVTGTQTGIISWRDVTTGEVVTASETQKGPVVSMRQNPANAVMHVGHNSGLVTLWTPNMPKPVVTMNCILGGQINDMAIDDSGNLMYVCGSDSTVKLWDLRKYQTVSTIQLHRAATSCDVSQGGLFAAGSGPHMSVYRSSDFEKLGNKGESTLVRGKDGANHRLGPYLEETWSGQNIRKVRFVPYEDLLGVGFQGTFRQCIVPGAGAANFDSWEANPFETGKQRSERIVKGLLEKLQPDMITLDENAFSVMTKADQRNFVDLKRAHFKEELKHDIDLEKKRMKGRGNVKNKEKRKKIHIVDDKNEKFQEHLQQKRKQQEEKNKEEQRQKQRDQNNGVVKSALDRFM